MKTSLDLAEEIRWNQMARHCSDVRDIAVMIEKYVQERIRHHAKVKARCKK